MNALSYSFLSQREGVLARAENFITAARENRELERECLLRGEYSAAARHAERRQFINGQLSRLAAGPRGPEVRELLKSIGGH